MMVVHGFNNNRFQYKKMMEDFCNRYNVVCASPEYRGCGYDANKKTGYGVRFPYDYNYKQVMDTLNLLKFCLNRYKPKNGRLIAWGGSQGGHNVLLCSAFANNTFCLTIDACGPVKPHRNLKKILGKVFSAKELFIRNVLNFTDRITNKVYIFHGSSDRLVKIKDSLDLEKALKSRGAPYFAHYVKGGDHFLGPKTTREKATVKYASKDILKLRRKGKNDFELKSKVIVGNSNARYLIDFSKAVVDIRECR